MIAWFTFNFLKVFLDPLKRVVNISAVDNLLQCCTTQAQRTLLQAIGITVGIKSWTDDYKAMIKKAGDHSVSEASATTEDRAVLSASVSQVMDLCIVCPLHVLA